MAARVLLALIRCRPKLLIPKISALRNCWPRCTKCDVAAAAATRVVTKQAAQTQGTRRSRTGAPRLCHV